MNLYKLLQEALVNEYINRDMVSLKYYLTMSDDGKKEYLTEMFYYFFDDFLAEEQIEFTPVKPNVDVDGEEVGDELEGIELVEWVERNNPELIQKFKDYLFDKIRNSTLPINDAEYPAWAYFDYQGLVKNQWLIHFTNEADY